MELMQILDSARVDVTRAHLARHYPKRVKKLITTLGEDDKKFDAEVKALPEAERERAVMQRAFTFFDLDGSDEIDRLEFRAMMRSGRLIEAHSRPGRQRLQHA